MTIQKTKDAFITRASLRIRHAGPVGYAFLLAMLAACGGNDDAVGPDLGATPQRVFLACRDSTVNVFDVAQDRVIAAVPVPGRPVSLAASPDGRRIYAGLATPGGIVEIDAVSLAVLRTVPGPPMGLGIDVSPDGRTLVATTDSAGLVMILSLADGGPLDSVRTGGSPQYIRVDRTSRTAYTPIFETGELAVINLSTRSVEARTVLGEFNGGPSGVAVAPNGGMVYVGIFGYGLEPMATDFLLVDAASRAVFRRYRAGPWQVDVDITADGREVFLTTDQIRVYDVVAGKMTDSIPIRAFGLAVPDAGDVFYAVPWPGNTLEAIRLSDHVPVSSYPVGVWPAAVEANFRP
jgi:DNA-binding beta-propeller fold protein YncE